MYTYLFYCTWYILNIPFVHVRKQFAVYILPTIHSSITRFFVHFMSSFYMLLPLFTPSTFFRYQNMFHLFCSHMINCNTDHRYTTYLIIYNIPIIHLSVNPFFNHLAFIYVTLPYIAFFIPYFTN